jgi:hypothetical protein
MSETKRVERMLTSFDLPDDCKIVVVLDKSDADALGSLLQTVLRMSKDGGGSICEKLPAIGRILNIWETLQNDSYALEDGAWLQDARCSLARGDAELKAEVRGSNNPA